MWALAHRDTEERLVPVHKPRNRLPSEQEVPESATAERRDEPYDHAAE